MLGGQTGGAPIEETENGILAFDGNVWPPDEIKSNIRTPIKCKVEKGIIKEISGGVEADILRTYLAGLNDRNMYRVAHVCYGFHPKARVTGDISEVERVWGCFQVGWGSQGPLLRPDLKGAYGWKAASHDDGIILKASIYLDGEPVQKDGKFVHPELLPIIKEMGVEQ
jgi:leucyl aminopeptidase (aminopeptidase T)